MVRGALAGLLALEPDIEVVARSAAATRCSPPRAQRADVALLDIEMPGANGLGGRRRAARASCRSARPHPHDVRPPGLPAPRDGGGRRRLPAQGRAGHRQPHRQDLRGEITDGTVRGDGPAPDQGRRGRLRADDLRPGVHEHRVVPLARSPTSTATSRHPRVPRLPDRAAREQSTYLEVAYLLVHGELPTRSSSTSGRTRSRSTRSCTRTSRSSCRASATTRTRWGCCSASVGALSTFYPDAKEDQGRGEPLHARSSG
jgi:hypothetical protein